MKYNVGYQLLGDASWIDAIVANSESVSELYFSWEDMPNGRNSTPLDDAMPSWEAQQRKVEDIGRVFDAGIRLNVLFNANCYGGKSLSRELYDRIGNAVDYLTTRFALPIATTTSPLIARFLHANFESIEVRASVNMDIGTPRGMDYVRDEFDSFYLKRECNRDIDRIGRVSRWCIENGKKLYMLANSGCLSDCSAHVFHDNLVAHEAEIRAYDNAYSFEGQCWRYLADRQHQVSVLRDTSFVRPEDIGLYEQWFEGAKLATRVSRNPVQILRAYVRGQYSGSLLDLMEPNHSGALYPRILENARLPRDFGDHVLRCDHRCELCDYCRRAFEDACVSLDDAMIYQEPSINGYAGHE